MIKMINEMEDNNIFYFAARRPYYKDEVLSLQSTVLKVIAINFKRYIHALNSPDSPIPKYYFELLQKKYSQELLKVLIDNGNLRREFLDFVLNVHLHEISLQSVPGHCKIGAIKKRLIEIGQSLYRLSLMGAFNFHHLEPVLSHLPNVRKLELEYSNCDDLTMKVIANNCPLLKELNVYASLVSDGGLKYLCFPKQHKLELECLTVSRTNVKHFGILLILKYMPSIQVISHENLSTILSNGIYRNELSRDKPLNLTFIEVHHASTELQAISELCPNIKQLFVKDIHCTEQLVYCCAFKKLEDVCLSYSAPYVAQPPLCIDNFLQTCGLHINNLSLESFALSVNVLASSCPNLQILELCDPIFKELSYSSDARFEKLTYFKIYGCSLLSMEDVASPAFIIKSSPNLESMRLEVCFIGTHMEDAILHCPATLKQLDFRESLVSVNFLQEVLFRHQSLQCLIIENSGIHAKDFQKLWQLSDSLNHPVNIMWC